MSKRGHGLDHFLGQRMETTLPIRPRRKSEAELRAMPIEDRLLYEMANPKTEEDKLEELEREDRAHFFDLTGEIVDWADRDEPPPDWGT